MLCYIYIILYIAFYLLPGISHMAFVVQLIGKKLLIADLYTQKQIIWLN